MSFPVVVLLVCALQFYSRFAAAPVADFAVDDWAILVRAQDIPTFADAAALALKDSDRPFGFTALALLFKLFGDRPWCWALFSVSAYTLLMALIMAVARRLDARPVFALLVGAIFALLPNLTESFHWPTMIGYVGSTLGCVACALTWLAYLERGRMVFALLAGLALLFSLGTYEVGIGLPFALLALMDRRRWRSQVIGWLPCAAAVAVYLAWKFTHGFGWARGFLAPSRDIAISPALLFANARDTVSWWIGGKMFGCIEAGWSAFMTLAPGPFRLLFVAHVLVVAALVLAIRSASRGDAGQAQAFTQRQVIFFGLAWAAVSAGVSLLSWTGGRLNIVPAIGLALVAARLLCDLPRRAWVPVFAAAALLFLPANHGTAIAWRDSGAFHRNLFDFISKHEPEWRDAEVVLFDTGALRQRLTPGLLAPRRAGVEAWAFYRNAGLLRGFAPHAMMRLAAPGRPLPACVLDVECGAAWQTNELTWHERWNEAAPHRTPHDRVYVIDCYEAGAGLP